MNWDDLKIVRAVFQAGSYAAAAARLRVNETTVARRLDRLQQDLGVALFVAADGARKPTAHCKEIIALSETMASHAKRIERIGDAEIDIVERRRIAATDSIAAEVLAPRASAFLSDHGNLALEFMASTENVDFSRWQADLAIRLTKPEKGDFIMSKLTAFDLFLFKPAGAAAMTGDLVCAYPEDLDLTPESQYLKRIGLQDRARCQTKNLLVLKRLIQSRRCMGVMPSYMCADLMSDPALQFTKLPQPRGVWLLQQRHLKNDEPTRLVINWIKSCFAAAEKPTA